VTPQFVANFRAIDLHPQEQSISHRRATMGRSPPPAGHDAPPAVICRASGDPIAASSNRFADDIGRQVPREIECFRRTAPHHRAGPFASFIGRLGGHVLQPRLQSLAHAVDIEPSCRWQNAPVFVLLIRGPRRASTFSAWSAREYDAVVISDDQITGRTMPAQSPAH
jgi:hypothetical protein